MSATCTISDLHPDQQLAELHQKHARAIAAQTEKFEAARADWEARLKESYRQNQKLKQDLIDLSTEEKIWTSRAIDTAVREPAHFKPAQSALFMSMQSEVIGRSLAG